MYLDAQVTSSRESSSFSPALLNTFKRFSKYLIVNPIIILVLPLVTVGTRKF